MFSKKVSLGIVAAAALLSPLMLGATAASADEGDVQTYVNLLDQSSEPAAEEVLNSFESLTAAQQEIFVDTLQSPEFLEELTTVDPSAAAVQDSAEFPGVVNYVSESEFQASAPDVSASAARAYPGNSTQRGSWSTSALLFNIPVTTLEVFVVFQTDKNGLPSKTLSSGSASRNLNFFVNISSTNALPYIQKPGRLAVATTTWHGCALFKGAGACFDKVQTAKFFQGGFYSGQIRNV